MATGVVYSTQHNRNLGVDMVRGLSLIFIFINHIPGNEAQLITPSLWGWSDAAEAFVFCAGWASGTVYGATFRNCGFSLGIARIIPRIFRIYWVHVGLFLALLLTSIVAESLFPEANYREELGANYFFKHPDDALLTFMLLRYLPSWLDILPLYLVLLSTIPLFHLATKILGRGVMALSLSVYLIAFVTGFNLSAEPLTQREWFFNPFCWQLVFFSGYAFSQQWFLRPPAKTIYVLISLLVVLLAVPFSRMDELRTLDWMDHVYGWIAPLSEKQSLGPLRLLHFAGLGYLMVIVFGNLKAWYENSIIQILSLLGRNSLPVFTLQLPLDWIGRIYLDQQGHGVVDLILINGGGLLLMIVAGKSFDWLRQKPWQAKHVVTTQALVG